MKLQGIGVVIGLLCAASTALAQQNGVTTETERLSAVLQGSYNNEAQSRADADYFDIRMRIARIWRWRTDAVWLYMEQSLASMQGKPYRQRIYRLVQKNDTTVESAIFILRYPLRFAGEWRRENLLKHQTPDSLAEMSGCGIVLYRKRNGVYSGATTGSNCSSELRKAVYSTSDIIISADKLVMWDRGFDASGKQVWGAIKGGYEFVKKPE